MNDLRWNPAISGMLCTIASDYTIGSFKIKEKKKEIESKVLEKFNDDGLHALCAAWSPKGKQIVVGCKNGNIVQFKPDLKVARTISGPNPYIGEVVSILWISNYQFCAAYLGNEQGINVLIIDAPKGETNAIFTCYEDITYGVTDAEGEGTIPRYYFDHVPEWGLIIAASSNSSEVAVLGSTDKGITWNQWQLVDSGRAELPLIHTTESYPVGLAIDKSAVRKLPWGADSTLPHPVPILHILATSGQLCSFHMVNLTPNCPQINCPPTEIIGTPPQIQTGFETSFIMNGLATSTPLSKQPENVSERSKPISSGNIFNKFGQGSNFVVQPSTEKLKQEQKSEHTNIGIKLLEPTKEIQPQEIDKLDVKLTSVKEIIMQEPMESNSSADYFAYRAYIEERNLFEKELCNRLEPQTWECGTEEERQKLVDTITIIDQFLRELKKTTNSLSSDIAYLKALLLQSFAWVEETKSKKNAATNDITTRNCGDSNKIFDLQKLYYYTQTQLTQATKILDLEWSDHKYQEMSRMKIPYLEFIYQNLILHNKIIQEEKSKIDQLKNKWKSNICNNSIFGLNRSLSNLNITSPKSFNTLSRNTGIIEARCKAIASRTLSFTPEKQIKLRKHLSISTPRIIKPVNPSPSQEKILLRLEATLSSLNSLNITNVNIQNKMEQSTSKQNSVIKKQSIENTNQQSPLASLNSIVARIGTSETNASTQNKMQSKPNFGITFPSIIGNKTEKISNTLPITTISQNTKPKQDTIIFNQSNASAHISPNIIKSLSKVDTITSDISTQKSEEIAAQNSVWFKVENNLLNNNSLKDSLPSEISSEKIQTTTPNIGMTTQLTTITKTKSISTFSFATPITSTSIKSTTQNTFAASQTTNAQTFSFASKPSNITTSFNLKMMPSTTTSQTQDSLSLAGSFAALQTTNQISNVSNSSNVDGKYNYKPTFGTPGFQILLGQTSSENQISVKLVTGASLKETVTTTPSVTIEEIPSSESKTSTNSIQGLSTSSATPLFSSQTNTSNVSIFGGISNSNATITTCTITTTTPTTQTTTTSSIPLFGDFIPASSSIASTMTTSDTMSPFQTSLSKSFEKTTINLPTTNLTNTATTTSSTITFGNITTTSVASVFQPSLTMNSQFPSTPVVSSTPTTSEKSVFKPFETSADAFMFRKVAMTAASIFSGNNTNSIFGGNTQASSSPTSIFGGNASTISTFGSPQMSIFDNNAQKSDSIFGSTSNTGSTSFFGSTANNVTPALPSSGSTSVFGGTAVNTSPMGVEQPVLGAQPAFGQAPSFNTKPIFGSPPTFGAPKPIFGGGFGSTTFGVTSPSK